MTYELFLQKNTAGEFHGFLINIGEVWDCYQRSPNPREAIVEYYKKLLPLTDGQGLVLTLDITRWKEVAKILSATLYLNHPHISRVLPSVPSTPVCLLKNLENE